MLKMNKISIGLPKLGTVSWSDLVYFVFGIQNCDANVSCSYNPTIFFFDNWLI